MDLIEFLNARLDEDETVARAAIDDDGGHDCGLAEAGWLTDGRQKPRFADALAQMARTFAVPRRVLREVEAKRAILGACAETLQGEDSHDYITEGGTGEEYELARFAVRQMAAVYSDHPDYPAADS